MLLSDVTRCVTYMNCIGCYTETQDHIRYINQMFSQTLTSALCLVT